MGTVKLVVKWVAPVIVIALLQLVTPPPAWAMHIMEGFLPPGWALWWTAVTIPFIAWGLTTVKRTLQQDPELKLLLAMVGAFAFVLSALKLPSITGSSSHPTGVGLGSVLFGPAVMSVLGLIVLLFQALLLGHGGLTTLGANTFSMAVVGPLLAAGSFRLTRSWGLGLAPAVFIAAVLGDLATYVTTALQLALAFPDATGGYIASMVKFGLIFAPTQLPLAIGEGLLTVLILNLLITHSAAELNQLRVLNPQVGRSRFDEM